MNGDIKTVLLILPAEIAASETSVLNFQNSKIDLETRCSEIKAAVEFQIGTDTNLKNDTARKDAIKDLLNQNNEYSDKQKTLKDTTYQLELARINHQKLRDTFSAYLALVGVK